MPRPAAVWLLGVCGAPVHGFPEEATRGPIRPSSDLEGQSKAQSPSPPPAHIVPRYHKPQPRRWDLSRCESLNAPVSCIGYRVLVPQGTTSAPPTDPGCVRSRRVLQK